MPIRCGLRVLIICAGTTASRGLYSMFTPTIVNPSSEIDFRGFWGVKHVSREGLADLR